jgi:hypothetical protein
MVHIDLDYLMAYLLTAAAVLRPGGKLVMSVANAASTKGFQNLLDWISAHWRYQLEPSLPGRLEWLSPDLVKVTLDRLGFELEWFDAHDRNAHIFVTASLARPEVGDRLERHLRPGGLVETAR